MSGPATATATSSVAAKTKAKFLERFVCTPIKKFGCCFQNRAEARALKITSPLKERIAADSAEGVDTAVRSSKQFFQDQKQLLAYRTVRMIEESKHIFSGAYFKDYGILKAVDDLRFLTQCFFLFLIFVIIGRRSVFPPIRPDSPFVEGLKEKNNLNY